MGASSAPKRLPLTESKLTPPSLDRQHSYNEKKAHQQVSSGYAATVLANLRSRSMSPGRLFTLSTTSNSITTSATTPMEAPLVERRTSWEECMVQRDGYISFPDFDQLRAQAEQYANRQ